MTRAPAALLAACLAAPSPAAAAAVRVALDAAPTSALLSAPAIAFPSALGTTLSGPGFSAPNFTSAFPSLPTASAPAFAPSAAALALPAAAPASAPAAVALAPSAAIPASAAAPTFFAPAVAASAQPSSAVPAGSAKTAGMPAWAASAPSAGAPRGLDAFYDGAASPVSASAPFAGGGSAEAPGPSQAARAAAASPAARVVPEALVAAPRGAARLRGWAASALALIAPTLPAFALLAGGARQALLAFLTASAAMWAVQVGAADIQDRATRRAVVVGGTLLGAALGAAAFVLSGLTGGAAAVVVAASVGLATTALAVGAIAPVQRLLSRRRERVFLGAGFKGGEAVLSLERGDFGRLFLLSGALEKGLGEREFYAQLTELMERLVYLRRSGEFVELVARGLPLRAAPGSPMAVAASRVASDAVVGKARVRAEDSTTGAVTIKASELFAQDPFRLAAELEVRYGGSYGTDADTSRVESLRAFPRNAELSGRLVLVRRDGPAGEADEAGDSVPDLRRLPLSLRLSLSALPEPGFHPRRADPRVGHFTTVFQDWSRPAAGVETALVQHWRLEKQDPAAAASKVKTPIVYWIDPSVPKEYRAAVARGVLKWNKAFARVGLLDAVEAREAPEDGSFDASDARHTVISWRLDPDAPYAIGPARADPLTGEIYQANVSISGKHLLSALEANFKDLQPNDFLDRDEARAPAHCHGAACGHAAHAAENAAAALGVIEARGRRMSDEERRRFAEDYITDLVLHEVGHTLGLRHNFLGRNLRSFEEVEAGAQPQTSSVMDYLAPNVARPGRTQTPVWNADIGPYDEWAIEYAYKPLDGLSPEQEAEALAQIAGRSGEPGLDYSTDEDLVEKDPDSRHWASGRDALAFARAQTEIARGLWDALEKPELAAEAYRLYIVGWRLLRDAERHATTAVGGVSFRRGRPAEAVSGARQREALDLLEEFLFAEQPFEVSAALRGRLVSPQSPTLADQYPAPFHISHESMTLWLRQDAIERLLSVEVLDRLAESARLVGKKAAPLTPIELLTRLDRMVWSELFSPGRRKGRAISGPRRQAQEFHLNLLLELGYVSAFDEAPEISSLARAHAATLGARLIRKLREGGWDETTRAYLKQQIAKFEAARDQYEP